MANLTLKIEDEILKHARIRSIEEGTSVNEVVRKFLAQYAAPREARIRAARDFLKIAAQSKSSGRGRKWTRDELYAR